MNHSDGNEEHIGGTRARRIAMRMAYDGTDFLGWQRQAIGRTVQSTLETMLARLSGDQPVTVVGAGRTDSGVHAAGQVAHAEVDTSMDDAALLHSLRRMSPADLVVLELRTVASSFHARFSAMRRTYRYTLLTTPDPFRARYGWYVGAMIDRMTLASAAAELMGRHDFTALSKINPDTPNPMCEILDAKWSEGDSALLFELSADRFLYGMVRMLVGLQIDIACGRRSVDDVATVIASRDRGGQSQAAPARGLSLVDVGFPVAPFGNVE